MTAAADPSLSFLMITYNQERHVRAALASALAQDCEGLEIVVCDDCSTDRTYDVLQEMVGAYRGPHRVVLRRNPRNLGICGNFQRACSLAGGRWLCMAAGDDVFSPRRASVLLDGIRSHPGAGVVGSRFRVIDAEGRPWRPPAPPAFTVGASLCWHRDVLERFPPIPPTSAPEDTVLIPRVFYLGRTMVILPDTLLDYRVHEHFRLDRRNTTRDLQKRLRWALRFNLEALSIHRRDYECARRNGWIPTSTPPPPGASTGWTPTSAGRRRRTGSCWPRPSAGSPSSRGPGRTSSASSSEDIRSSPKACSTGSGCWRETTPS